MYIHIVLGQHSIIVIIIFKLEFNIIVESPFFFLNVPLFFTYDNYVSSTIKKNIYTHIIIVGSIYHPIRLISSEHRVWYFRINYNIEREKPIHNKDFFHSVCDPHKSIVVGFIYNIS